MRNIRKWSALIGTGAVIFTLAGCADRNKNGQPDSPATSTEIDKTVDKTENAVANGVSAASKAVQTAAPAAEKAVSNAAQAVTVTPKVQSALDTNPGLKGLKLNADTLGAKDSVAIRGTVKTAAQKTLAEAVAKQNAPGYKIIDQLKVGK